MPASYPSGWHLWADLRRSSPPSVVAQPASPPRAAPVNQPLQPRPDFKISAVVVARNEAATIGRVISQLHDLGATEIIAVVNGSRDGTEDLAQGAGADVLSYVEPLGHDVGKALGALRADGDAVLFLDADFAVPATSLQPFVDTIAGGADVALNDLRSLGTTWRGHDLPHLIPAAACLLNHTLGRPDLGPNSLTISPYALSRRAVARLGRHLGVPPLALALAIEEGLAVSNSGLVNVYTLNRHRPGLHDGSGEETIWKLILGDYLEATNYFLAKKGPRGGCTDLGRRRDFIDRTLTNEGDQHTM